MQATTHTQRGKRWLSVASVGVDPQWHVTEAQEEIETEHRGYFSNGYGVEPEPSCPRLCYQQSWTSMQRENGRQLTGGNWLEIGGRRQLIPRTPCSLLPIACRVIGRALFCHGRQIWRSLGFSIKGDRDGGVALSVPTDMHLCPRRQRWWFLSVITENVLCISNIYVALSKWQG